MSAEVLDLAALGWRLFPVARDGRTPLLKSPSPGEGGCHAATDDADQLAAWWQRWPSANVALACGPLSDVLALDIDRHGSVDGFAALAELQAEFGPLPATVRSETPGGGEHRLFRYPEGAHPPNRVGVKRWSADGSRRVYHGLDVRGWGASICVPPSSKAAGAYRWRSSPFGADLATVPAWLLALLRSEPPPRPVRPLRLSGTPDRLARYICSAVDGECRELAAMPPGSGRNQRLFVGSAKLGTLVGAGVLGQEDAEAALERAAAECGLIGEDGLRAVRLTIASGMKRGIAQPREIAA